MPEQQALDRPAVHKHYAGLPWRLLTSCDLDKPRLKMGTQLAPWGTSMPILTFLRFLIFVLEPIWDRRVGKTRNAAYDTAA